MKLITTKYAGPCISCGEDYDIGEKVYWAPGFGVWHVECKPPQSVEKDQKLQERRRRLGLEPYEFGKAPTRY